MLAIGAARALPNETWSNILGFLSLHDLASVSLASKTWQALAFPGLYRTVYLALGKHLKDLAERTGLDREGSLSLRSHIRGLIFDQSVRKAQNNNGSAIVEEDLEYLEAILPVLTRLDHFYWQMGFVPHNQRVVNTLQTGCSNLKSVELMLYGNIVFEEAYDDYIRLLEFKNLVHLTLTVKSIPFDYDEHYSGPLVALLRACSNLESLSLDLRDWSDIDGIVEWSPDVLINALDSPTFPSLRTFRVLGFAAPDWYAFFRSPTSSPLRSFFSRHPNLHTVGLGWVYERGYYERIEPEEIAKLIPFLRHLEAPAFFCVPVVASSLANQLETVAVLDDKFGSDGFNLHAIADSAATLPKLRKLTVCGEVDNEIEVAPLKALLNSTPCLEELELRVPLDEPNQLLNVLRLTPNLRVLFLCPHALSVLSENLGVPEWKECFSVLANTCRLIRCVKASWYGVDDYYWFIKREADGTAGFFECSSQ